VLAERTATSVVAKQDIEGRHQQSAINTPRTREACRKLGFVMEDLEIRPPESFRIPGDPKESRDLMMLRFERYEKNRKRKLEEVIQERAKVIADNAKKGAMPGAQNGQFLSMLESLFEKEAKRLEVDLKSQLRQHSSLVKLNDEQLRKEEMLAQRMKARQDASDEAENKRRQLALKTKENTDSRFQAHALNEAELKRDADEKKRLQADRIEAENFRMQEFRENEAKKKGAEAAFWKEKLDRMRAKGQELALQREEEGRTKLADLENKIQSVTANREHQQHLRRIESEKQHLDLMDVRSRKQELDRVDGYRRNELKDQIDNNFERIETLLALKDQLLDQRKARTSKAEATKNSRGINLSRDCAPGPGHYEAPQSCMFEKPAAKMNQANVPSCIDLAIKATASNPAPGEYNATRLKNGDVCRGAPKRPGEYDEVAGGGLKWGGGEKTSYLDDAIKAKASVPAPGEYKAPSQRDTRATKIQRDRIVDENLDRYSAKKYPVWARPGTDTPGPAGYSVDDYSRKEGLRRAQRSLPSLTRDMLRPPKVQA